MQFNITGIQAQSKKNVDTFKTLRPIGAVSLIPEPENKYDRFCVGVWFGDVLLGYIPALKQDGKYVGSELQRHILEEGIKTARIAEYTYLDGDDFNKEHRGHLGSVTLEIDVEDSSNQVIGGDYIRVTDFISFLNPYGKSDGLIKWAYDQGGTYEDYESALSIASERGTAMHMAIESVLQPSPIPWETGEPDKSDLPAGWDKFVKKYELDTIHMEERFYDSTLMVTGQPDWFGYCNGKLMVLDWKSSKKPSIKHKLQLSIYAMNCQFDGDLAEGAMVVCFGAENKQGFSTSCMTREQIETTYEAMRWLRKVVDAVAYTGKW